MVILSTEPSAFGNYVFSGCSNLTKIIVPSGCANIYKSTSGWSSYKSKIVAAS
jgi:hypothetical protein